MGKWVGWGVSYRIKALANSSAHLPSKHTGEFGESCVCDCVCVGEGRGVGGGG